MPDRAPGRAFPRNSPIVSQPGASIDRVSSGERLVVVADGVRLVGERTGTGRPVVVLLHAGVADRRSWREVTACLAAEGFRGQVVAYDRRGFGDTPPSPPGFTHLGDLIAVLDHVSPDAPAWLVGSSMGGALALEAAVAAPGRVAGLVLVAPAVPGAPQYPDDPPATAALVERHRLAYEQRDHDEINRVEAHLWLDGPAAPEGRVGGRVRELFLAMNAVVLANEGDEQVGDADVDVWEHLAELTVPVTLVYGALDADVPREEPPLFAQRLPSTAVHRWPDRSHLPYLEDPDQTARLVRDAIPT